MFTRTRIAILSSLLATVMVLAAGSGSASAATATQQVSGTALGLLAIASVTPATFTTGFQAGSTATATGSLLTTDTSPSWTLSVEDTATASPGHMVAGSTGCSDSATSLQDPLAVTVTSVLGGSTSAGAVSISGSNQTVNSATNQLLAASIFTTSYSQTFAASEALRAGCVYSLTATYTLQ
jgi:hypothetical protein